MCQFAKSIFFLIRVNVEVNVDYQSVAEQVAIFIQLASDDIVSFYVDRYLNVGTYVYEKKCSSYVKYTSYSVIS